MPVTIKGKTYYLIDIIFDDTFIYEVYEDEDGHRMKKRIDYRRN